MANDRKSDPQKKAPGEPQAGWYSTASIAHLFKLSKVQVHYYITRGALKAERVGNQWLIRPDAAQAFQRRMLRLQSRKCHDRLAVWQNAVVKGARPLPALTLAEKP